MISGFEKIVEERIRRAQERGDFQGLDGVGRPLELADDSYVPEDLRLAFKVLKNAECLPPEVELRKEIEKTEDLLAAMPDTAEKYRTLKKLNFMVLKLNAMRRASAANDIPQHYAHQIVARLENAKEPK
ncbi:MAG: DnaJ family domain-containing protein [Desulfobacterales bacterium]